MSLLEEPISRMKNISGLNHDNIVHILSYLRAVDLVAARSANNEVFNSRRLSEAIEILGKDVYNLPSTSPIKKSLGISDGDLKRPEYLYNKELQCLSTALSSQPPLDTRGYYVSAMWLSGAKKFIELLQKQLNEFETIRRAPTKRKVSRRREVECPAPSSSMTADITCPHGALALSSARSKRKALTPRMWHFLRRFYPAGPVFKCGSTTECATCTGANCESSVNAQLERKQQQEERRLALVPPLLEPLYARRSGVPMHCVTSRVAYFSGFAAQDGETGEQNGSEGNAVPSAEMGVGSDYAVQDFSDGLVQPLIPGLYNLVPREWLRAWRSYVKGSDAARVPHLSCAALVCQAHRQLVVPPHLEEYLIGLRPTLLGGLGMYPGEVVEVLSADEWDALQDVFHDAGDFSARFCLDGSGGVYWSSAVCTVCEPLTYTPLLGRTEKKRNNAARAGQADDLAPYAVL